MGRKAGSLARFRCCVCSTVELVSGGSNLFRCSACRSVGRYRAIGAVKRSCGWLGKERAGQQVGQAIREGRLPHPKGLPCDDCAKPAVEYEHRDYNKPLAVVPICRSCNLRRGPAIPLAGTIEEIVARGCTPYRNRANVLKLAAMLGIDQSHFSGFPGTLTNEHWRQIAPLLIGQEGAPAVETAKAA